MYNYDELTGLAHKYVPELDVESWFVLTPGAPGYLDSGHGCHLTLTGARLMRMRLYLAGDVDAYIKHIPASGPPRIEEQLDAARAIDNSKLYDIMDFHNLGERHA